MPSPSSAGPVPTASRHRRRSRRRATRRGGGGIRRLRPGSHRRTVRDSGRGPARRPGSSLTDTTRLPDPIRDELVRLQPRHIVVPAVRRRCPRGAGPRSTASSPPDVESSRGVTCCSPAHVIPFHRGAPQRLGHSIESAGPTRPNDETRRHECQTAAQMTMGKGHYRVWTRAAAARPLKLYGLDPSDWNTDEEMFDPRPRDADVIMTQPGLHWRSAGHRGDPSR